jgi:Leucine-rich repeat (LRR) protein
VDGCGCVCCVRRQILDIRDNQLVGLPESIGLLHANLKKLLLGRNRISALPATLGMLSNLVHLQLNWNQLTALPDEIGACTALEELQLSYNKLRMIPQAFSNLTNLKFAALQNNLLELLPTCLGNMPNLHKLAFDNNMWLMPQQEVLSWSAEHNLNSNLKLSTGMRVWCRYQKLQRWRPARVDEVHPDGTFDLSYTFDRDPMGGIDREVNVTRYEEVERNQEVERLDLVKPLSDHERLVDFLTRLHSSGKNKELDFSGFHITEFLDYDAGSGFKYINEAGWYTRGLRKLHLAHNRLSTLPLSVSRLSTLTAMDLQHNVLIGLPETLSVLVCLRELDLSNNCLTVLPCGLGLAVELEKLVTHHNPLIAPPIEVIRQGAQQVTRYLRGVVSLSLSFSLSLSLTHCLSLSLSLCLSRSLLSVSLALCLSRGVCMPRVRIRHAGVAYVCIRHAGVAYDVCMYAPHWPDECMYTPRRAARGAQKWKAGLEQVEPVHNRHADGDVAGGRCCADPRALPRRQHDRGAQPQRAV